MDDTFAAAADRLGEAVPCRRGCSSCCRGVFEIHPPDAALLALGLETLDPADRRAVVERARAVTARVAARAASLRSGEPAFRDWRPSEGLATVPASAWARLADDIDDDCPVLGPEGECRLHAYRPAVCRLQGLPWRDPATGAELPDFCRLDSRQERLPHEPFALAGLDVARSEARERLAAAVPDDGRLPCGRTFVAEALARLGLHEPGGDEE